jgi:hypothetical protein
MPVKQIPVADHVTPVHSEEAMRRSFVNAVTSHYGHCFRVCKYCGWYNHKDYVCSCGVDTGYLEDENGRTVQPLVEVYEVPVKEKARG